MSCADEEVYIVGGANSAGQAAMHFSRYAAKVHMLVRGDSLTRSMSKYLIDQIEATPNIVVETCTEVVAMSGNGRLECLTLKTPRRRRSASGQLALHLHRRGSQNRLAAQRHRARRQRLHPRRPRPEGAVARSPGSSNASPYLLETSVPGIFVAGDVRFNSVKRCASAVGEGSIAIQFVHQYLATL